MSAVTALAVAATLTVAGVQPQLAGHGSTVYLVVARADVIHVARSTDGGDAFAAPVALPGAGRLALGMHRGPRVATTGRAVLVSAIAGQRGGGADGDVVLYRSADDGTTWSAPQIINDVPGSAREGLHAMAADPSGLAVIAWLDLRAGGTRLYAAVSRDHGLTWSADTLVYTSPSGSICECCHPSVAIGRGGRIAVMFRNSLGGHRDLHASISTDSRVFQPARKLGTGSWPLNACPMDGGGAAFLEDVLVAAWRRADGIFLTTGQAAERRLGTGRDAALHASMSHIDVAWSTDSSVVLWREGRTLPIGPGRFPSLLALADRTVLAWEQNGQAHVRAIRR